MKIFKMINLRCFTKNSLNVPREHNVLNYNPEKL